MHARIYEPATVRGVGPRVAEPAIGVLPLPPGEGEVSPFPFPPGGGRLGWGGKEQWLVISDQYEPIFH